ncbi:MAG: hypothetical protein NXI10_01810 [bacterium]|nr:hypothetical protein [bacterium]
MYKIRSIPPILRNIIYLNVVVSFAAGTLCAGFAKMIGWEPLFVLLFGGFAFFGTLAVYNGQRLFKVSDVKTPWLNWVEARNGEIRWLTIIASVLSLGFSVAIFFGRPFVKDFGSDFLRIATWMSPAVMVSFLYIFRLKGKNLRDIPHLKIHLIAFSWVFILILFPFLMRFYVGLDFIRPFIALIIGHYFYVVAVTIPFDIRDLKYDKDNQKTIPQRVGVNGAKLIAVGLLLVSAVFLTGLTPIRIDNYWFYGAIFTQVLLVLGMNTERSDFYCAGWIDGAIALLGLAYFMN